MEKQEHGEHQHRQDGDDRHDGDPGHAKSAFQVGAQAPQPDDGDVHLHEQQEEHHVGGRGHVLDRERHGHADDDERREQDGEVRSGAPRVHGADARR